ncbi:hypothetical protein [Brevundimonas denitrificans]|uniref:hypothetical protein n=1 Tax=Brevundimonas denitrificans TaxID=1443434 RepID=UPI00352E0FBF
MPLQINVVTQAEFEAWIAERGGAMPGAESAEDAATEASTAEAEVTETEDSGRRRGRSGPVREREPDTHGHRNRSSRRS